MTVPWTRESSELRTVASGLEFPESPRWHEGALWFSDILAKRVMRIGGESGEPEEVLHVESSPSGLGWLPDGRLLIVAMHDRQLLRHEVDGTVSVLADLGHLAVSSCNDLLVDGAGVAYVGQFGFDAEHDEPRSTQLLRVDPDGTMSVAAEDLNFPNGAVLTPDGSTLVIAESWTHDLTAFDVGADGSLHHRRLWAHLEGAAPDGICADAEGAVWAASPISKEVLRIEEGGRLLGRVSTGSRRAIACMLGGPTRNTLYICTAGSRKEADLGASGRIEAIEVDVPGAGLP